MIHRDREVQISLDSTTIRFAPARYDSAYEAAGGTTRNTRYIVWSKWEYASPQLDQQTQRRYVRTLELSLIDCKRRRLAALSTSYYTSKGNVLRTYGPVDPAYTEGDDVVPETYGEMLVDTFCSGWQQHASIVAP